MNRFKVAKRASILGIICNIFLLSIKGVVGFITNSQAMIADAFNSTGDIFSSVMTYIGNKIASQPSDDDHNLGHGKAEYIFSMLMSIVMILTSLLVLKGAILSMLIETRYEFSKWLIVVCIVTITIKFILYLYTSRLAKKHNNLLIKANSKDHRNDCFMTTLTLISCICSYFNIKYVDGIVGVLITIWIFISSVLIFIESYNVLMDKSIKEDTKKKVFEIINRHSEVLRTQHFNSTPIGYRYQISFTIFVDGNLSTFESHDIANSLEKEIRREIEEIYLVVIHVNPMNISK